MGASKDETTDSKFDTADRKLDETGSERDATRRNTITPSCH
jgi:hypothetical protein